MGGIGRSVLKIMLDTLGLELVTVNAKEGSALIYSTRALDAVQAKMEVSSD